MAITKLIKRIVVFNLRGKFDYFRKTLKRKSLTYHHQRKPPNVYTFNFTFEPTGKMPIWKSLTRKLSS
jgi:hypothetical protein